MRELHLIYLENAPILHQLAIEEAFLRADHRNICIINSGSSKAIVMGISGKKELFVDPHVWEKDPVPVIKRFSGGGTVFVDSSTIFVTWIWNSKDIGVECCPNAIHKWSETIYREAFPSLGMVLKENDYVIKDKKFGGNAQYLTKGRWLHHSSLLWDYNSRNMNYLLMPKKRPNYRIDRNHDDFLCRLQDHFPSLDNLKSTLISSISSSFHVKSLPKEEINIVLNRPHRKATVIFNP